MTKYIGGNVNKELKAWSEITIYVNKIKFLNLAVKLTIANLNINT
jgi:hypothetical protein